MKVLILTCSTGEGHNSAAKAIESVLQSKNISCVIKDPVSFQSERMTKLVSNLYNDTIRKAPKVFGAVYKIGDIYSSSSLPSPVYWANSKYADALKFYIYENNFTHIICTHLYGMEVMTAIRKDPEFKIPTFGVLTDYVSIPFLDETNLSRYFISTEDAGKHLISKGIAPENIQITGIPVDLSFTYHLEKQKAREQLGLPMNRHLFLVMTGGVGCENMEHLCSLLVNSIEPEDLAIVFTGKNKILKQRLEQSLGHTGKLTALGFTDEVSAYMAAGDVLLSKPGGLSSTEAAVANIPLVHIHGIPGCETYNVKFFSAHGMSCSAQNDEDAVAFSKVLAYNQDSAERMRKMQMKYVNPHAAEDIVEEVIHYAGK